MMPMEIAPKIYDVGVTDWTVRDFHGYKTERGASYNSYLIMDEKICLIDTVKACYADELLEKIRIKGQVVTIDAMGTQKEIAEKIRKKKGDYVLALKENQKTLYEDVRLFFCDEQEKEQLKQRGTYCKTIENAHGQTEIREYYQTERIGWLSQKKEWEGLKSIGMEEKTIQRDGKEKKEYRYYISSLKEDEELFSRAVRGHWSVESMHWHLDVTFKEAANTTLDKQAAENLNIIRKWCISILKMVEIFRPNLSMKKKRFVISMNPEEFLEQVLSF